jgi:hypothetical protein
MSVIFLQSSLSINSTKNQENIASTKGRVILILAMQLNEHHGFNRLNLVYDTLSLSDLV